MTRDPHAFGPGDEDIVLPRKLATAILEDLESWRDIVRIRGVNDSHLDGIIAELTRLLEA